MKHPHTTTPPSENENLRWYRGQLHSHSYWSDGRGFLEQAAAAHRERGYHFLFITDHNRIGNHPDEWRPIMEEEGSWPPKISRENFDRYLDAFGSDWVEQRTASDGTREVRLKTLDEVKTRMDVPESFLLLPGVELTQAVGDRHLHTNCLNFPVLTPTVRDANLIQKFDAPTTHATLLTQNAIEARQTAEAGVPYALMVNHPMTFYYDVDPRDVIDRFEYRLLEICGSGPGVKSEPCEAAGDYTPERFWDMVNAFRLRAGGPLVYGTGTDDAHFYDPARIEQRAGVGAAWVMVRSMALNPESLIAAMQAGDFYTSTGVLLNDVAFDSTTNTLHVQVHPESDTDYRIVFVTTKVDFDPAIHEVTTDDGSPQRTLPICSEDIGKVVKVVEGTDASYRLSADDLYVRARVESNRAIKRRGDFSFSVFPSRQTAWTQPYEPA